MPVNRELELDEEDFELLIYCVDHALQDEERFEKDYIRRELEPQRKKMTMKIYEAVRKLRRRKLGFG